MSVVALNPPLPPADTVEPVEAAAAQAPKSGGLRAGRVAVRVFALLAFVGTWQLLAHYRVHLGLVTFENVPAPSEVVPTLWALLQSPKVADHVSNSLYRVFAGFFGAAAAGIGLGLFIGRSRWVADLMLPPLEVLRPIPGVAWIPLAILMFPSSELSMIFITFMGALFPILLNTIHGVEGLDPRLTATARSLGAGRLRLFFEVILPGAAPSIVTGLSIGMGTAWFCLVTAEMIAGQYGIGYLKLPETVPALARCATEDSDYRVRRSATGALLFGQADEVVRALLQALRDSHWQVREEAAVTLGRHLPAEAVDGLIAALDDKCWEVTVKAANALGRLRATRAIASLSAVLEHRIGNVRKEAATALAAIGGVAVIPPLKRALADSDVDVRKIAARALAGLEAAA